MEDVKKELKDIKKEIRDIKKNLEELIDFSGVLNKRYEILTYRIYEILKNIECINKSIQEKK